MAVTNSVCITQNTCKKIVIEDSSDWDIILPNIVIDSTEIEVTNNSNYYSHKYVGYQETIEVTSQDLGFGSSSNLSDGIYTIKVTYIDNETLYVVEEEIFIICNIQCIVDTLIANIASNPCDECDKDKKNLALNATLKLDALEASIACGDLTKAQSILDWLNSLLINYNCKNC